MNNSVFLVPLEFISMAKTFSTEVKKKKEKKKKTEQNSLPSGYNVPWWGLMYDKFLL